MIDAGVGGRGDLRLGVIGHAKARLRQHGEIIGAVADGQRLRRSEAIAIAQFDQGGEFRLAAEDGFLDLAEETAVVTHQQRVGAVLVEPDRRRDRVGEQGETAGDEAGESTGGTHGGDQQPSAGREGDTLRDHFGDDGNGQAGEERDALAQRRFERDLAAHCPLGDRRHMLALADEIREFVNAFLADHGGIHVGEEQALAAPRLGLDDDVDRQTGQCLTHTLGQGCVVIAAGGGKGDVGRDAAIEPDGRSRHRQQRRGAGDHRLVERGRERVADQGGDMGHGKPGQDERSGRVVLIAGPTASGKSALALALAQRTGGVVINADSMQVYRDLAVITARPGAEEEAKAPHRLYGHVDAAETYSTGRWFRDVAAALAEAEAAGRLPIVTGGTGLYFTTLTRGLAAVPPIPEAVRVRLRERLAAEGAATLHAELATRDPVTAGRLRSNDGVRIVRALEVLEATGRSLSSWHEEELPPLVDPARTVSLFVHPDRETLVKRIEQRFDAMLAGGALEEVARLARRGLDPLLPAMKAHGVPWLIQHLAGAMSLDEAASLAKRDTRRYAKRQLTWFRNQLADWPWIAPEAALDDLLRRLAR